MKKAQHIIIHLFLLGMLLSVLQYLPSFEDDSSSPGTELAKKVKEDTSGNSDDEDGDSDVKDDLKTDLYSDLSCYYFLDENSKADFLRDSFFYGSRVSNVNTPPPKV